MASNPPPPSPLDDALAPLPAGETFTLRHGAVEVELAPDAGGRIAQIRFAGTDWLVGPGDGSHATIAWGCYPMVPWAGRVRGGRFGFGGRHYRLPVNMAPHAIHGLGFSRPWQVESRDPFGATLALRLPRDEHWPFGGLARQRVTLAEASVHLELSVEAGACSMPAVLGWHPWFRKPDTLHFSPRAVYPRDADGIATTPTAPPPPGPWDDCFVGVGTVVLERAGQRLGLASDASHWVVYDGAAHATCVEPQTGPPDAFNIEPRVLEPGERLALSFELAWAAIES